MPSNDQLGRVVVVGAGVAGQMAAQTLRAEGFDGELTLVGAERHAPYHRPALSKKLLTGEVHRAGIDMAPRDEFRARVLRSATAVGLDMTSRTVHLRDGGHDRALDFDGLVIASGAVVRQWPGGAPDGVLPLRTVDDCLAIRSKLDRRTRVVVVGGGFIGTEVAASIRSLGLKVTLLSRAGALLHSAIGEEMGSCWTDLHRQHGVDVRVDVKVDGFIGKRHVKAVRLSDGSKVKADLVLIGLGVEPTTDWLQGSGIKVDSGVICDATGAAEGSTGVVAAGDVARWPNPAFDGEVMRVEHWTNAAEQGVYVGQRLLHDDATPPAPFAPVPFVWSDQYDRKIQTVGVVSADADLHVAHGSYAERQFVSLFGRNGRIVGALGFNRPRQVMQYRKLIAERASWEAALELAKA